MRRHYDTRTVQDSGKEQLINGKELLTARMHASGHVRVSRYWSEIVWRWGVAKSKWPILYPHTPSKNPQPISAM
jgi:hypothetical protein